MYNIICRKTIIGIVMSKSLLNPVSLIFDMIYECGEHIFHKKIMHNFVTFF